VYGISRGSGFGSDATHRLGEASSLVFREGSSRP
jgi:hypothetical protein